MFPKFFGVAGQAFAQVNRGGKRALKGGQAMRGRRQNVASQGNKFRRDLLGLSCAVTLQECGEGVRAATRYLGGTETLLHQSHGGFAEGSESAFWLFKKTGEELIHQGVYAVGCGRLLPNQSASAACDLADLKVNVFGRFLAFRARRTCRTRGPSSP